MAIWVLAGVMIGIVVEAVIGKVSARKKIIRAEKQVAATIDRRAESWNSIIKAGELVK